MSDLISRSALQKLFEAECVGECGCCKYIRHDPEGCALIDEASVEVPQVIHCRECEHWRPSPFRDPVLGWCIVAGHHRRPDYYCADADPKEGK